MKKLKIILLGLAAIFLFATCQKDNVLDSMEPIDKTSQSPGTPGGISFRSDGGDCEAYEDFVDEFCVVLKAAPWPPVAVSLQAPPDNPELYTDKAVSMLVDGATITAVPFRSMENEIDFRVEMGGRTYILTKSNDTVVASKAVEGEVPAHLNAFFLIKGALMQETVSAQELTSLLGGAGSATTGNDGSVTLDIGQKGLLPDNGAGGMLLLKICDWEKARTINRYLSRIGWPNNDLSLYPDYVETALDDCNWKCNECLDPMCVFEGITGLLVSEEDIAEARLTMLRYSLQLSSESEAILSADNYLIEDMFRLTLDKGVCFFIDVDCGQIVTEDALNAVEYFSNFGSDDPYLLYGGEECIENLPYYELWLILGTFYPPQQIIDQIENIWDDNMIVSLYNATSSGAATNLDFHSVKICNLPAQIEPVDLFQLIRSEFYVDPFDSDCGTDFELYEEFSDEDWIDNPEGTMFEIEILPIVESGDVVCSFYDDTDDVNTEYFGYRWIFSTVYGRESGWHPVSGNRQFGLYPDGNGCWIFYTAGVDRQTNWYHVLFGGETAFQEADALWDCIIDKVGTYVNQIGGTASDAVSLHCRPDIDELIATWRSYCYNPPYFEMYPPCTDCQ